MWSGVLDLPLHFWKTCLICVKEDWGAKALRFNEVIIWYCNLLPKIRNIPDQLRVSFTPYSGHLTGVHIYSLSLFLFLKVFRTYILQGHSFLNLFLWDTFSPGENFRYPCRMDCHHSCCHHQDNVAHKMSRSRPIIHCSFGERRKGVLRCYGNQTRKK